MGEGNLPSPTLALSSSSISSSAAQGVFCHSAIASSLVSPSSDTCERAFLKLSSNFESLLSSDADDSFSDVVIYVSGQGVPLHRCILAARCSFFKDFFSKNSVELLSYSPDSNCKEGSLKLHIDLQRLVQNVASHGAEQVGYEAFIISISFLYSGKQIVPAIKCMDEDCTHEACWPAVKFGVEMLCLASIFDISDLKLLWQHQLFNMLKKAQVEEIFPVLVAASIHGPVALLLLAKHLLAGSALDTFELEKHLPLEVVDEILKLRIQLGTLQAEVISPTIEKQLQRFRKALDSDDVELVCLLLKERQLSLDDAYALHYAASYCDPRTLQELLELGCADVNLRDNRGLTVLHVAAMRQEPVILAGLLSKGANPLELTPDGRNAVQICKRQIKSLDYSNNVEDSEELQKNRLSVEILDQASRQHPYANVVFTPVADEKELLMRLLYLENRVAMARLLFPKEAKLVIGISQLEATSEFTGLRVPDLPDRGKKGADVDLNQLPISANELDVTASMMSKPAYNALLMKRVKALQRTVELAKRIFPCCTSIISSFMDDDICELSCIQMGSPEEQSTKRCRYDELKELLAEAFRKDVASTQQHKI
ncbi:hypothetical protein L7F22_053046 [Adiantum nelumboides]|nr:hypothetical protein [Adiantum nelumboides]